jgi:3-dehydroquinate dehydratase/shikimate dehydrogenase
MICVVIKGPSYEEALQQISTAMECADLVELRLDCFESIDMAKLQSLRSQFSTPMIFTLRCQSQGGNYPLSEKERLEAIRSLITLNPEYLDLENHIPVDKVKEIAALSPETKIILSYHNFIEMPRDLDQLYSDMKKTPADLYKIAVTPHNSIEAMRLLLWTKNIDAPVIAIGMGVHGQVNRVLGPMMGCPITYASLDENLNSAPGQLSAKILIERFHFRTLNGNTSLYGLIGDPVSHSISDETHNGFFRACGMDAIYVKIQVTPSELLEFLDYAKKLNFRGLSVTMPLKEHVIPYLDEIDPEAQEIGAVNTLLIKDGHLFGSNTDGFGALNAIEKECFVKDKRIVIIGAGGATKAIAFEAIKRGAQVTILNRDAHRAIKLAKRLDCDGNGLEFMIGCAMSGYDILINCTPIPMPISPDHILPNSIVMDIQTKPKETEFLKYAQQKKCRIIYGYRMFVEQAIGQYQIWFKDKLVSHEIREILERNALQAL